MNPDDHHSIPPWLIPDEEAVLASSERERELNEGSDAEQYRYTEPPESGRCPYCGEPYEFLKWERNELGELDYIDHFVHQWAFRDDLPDRHKTNDGRVRLGTPNRHKRPTQSCSPQFQSNPRRWQRSGGVTSYTTAVVEEADGDGGDEHFPHGGASL